MYLRLIHIPAKDEITLTFYSLILSYISFWLIAINLHFSDILNFIYQWLGNCWYWKGDYLGRLQATLQYSKFHLSLTGNCWWWRFPCPYSHTHIYIFMYILKLMSNNLVNQSTKAISTNELRWIGPVLDVMSSGPMDLFLSLMRGFTMAVFHWLLKVPLLSDMLTIFPIDCIHVCSISFILSVPM